MKIDIKFTPEEETLYLDFDNLKELKFYFEENNLEIDSISFDVDMSSLQRLQMLSSLDKEIQFRDATNQIISLSGSQIKNYIPTIESNLGERFEKINDIYNTYKVKLSAEEEITFYNAASGFFEYIYTTSFSQEEYDNIY